MHSEQDAFFEQLYMDNFWQLNRYARQRVGANKAEELVQDTFHDALQKIDILICHENPSGWLMVTLTYKIKNYLRRREKELLWLVSLDNSTVANMASVGSVDDFVAEKEDNLYAIEQIRRVLSQEDLYILQRLVYEKATHKEVAQELNITIWACQKRLERIRNKLGKLFPEYRSEK